MTVVDVSNYDYDDAIARGLTIRELMRCLKDAGVDRIIVNSWDLAKSRELISNARLLNIKAEDVYCFLYYGLGHERREVDHALILRSEFGIKRAWLDCESHWRPDTPTEAQGMTVGYRIATTANFRLELIRAGLRSGIYTGYYWWTANMGNFTGFADAGDDLWLAYYPIDLRKIHSLAEDYREGPFGGWKYTAAHQYSSTIEVCGRNRDHNHWFMEEPMTPDELRRLELLEKRQGRLQAIVAGHGDFPVLAREGNLGSLRRVKPGVINAGDLVLLKGDDTLEYLDLQGNNAYLGLAQMQAAMGQIASAVAGVAALTQNHDIAPVVKRIEEEFATLGQAFQELGRAIAVRNAPDPGEGETK